MKPPYKQLEYLKFLERENVNKIKQGICLQVLHTLDKCLGYKPWGGSQQHKIIANKDFNKSPVGTAMCPVFRSPTKQIYKNLNFRLSGQKIEPN